MDALRKAEEVQHLAEGNRLGPVSLEIEAERRAAEAQAT
jgi:hypothetical protein